MSADEELRGRLAEALPRSVGPAALRYPPEFGEPDPLTQFGREVLDALLPEVKRYAAEELRAAADDIEALSSHAYDEDDEAYEDAARRLRDRADALAPDDAEVRRG